MRLATMAGQSAVADNDVIFGPVRDAFPFQVEDWNDCTGETVLWDAVLYTFDYLHVSGDTGEQTLHVLSQFRWNATVHGHVTGYDLKTKGGGRDIVTSDPADDLPFQEVFIESSVLKPVTDEAPCVNFSALIRFKLDAGSNVVIDSTKYEYKCIGN